MFSDFRIEVEKYCVLLCCHTASGRHFLPTFRDKLSVPSLEVKKLKEIYIPKSVTLKSLSSIFSAHMVVASCWLEMSVIFSAVREIDSP
jgi:hypothetical protein